MSGGVFISYRREDSSGSARGIYDRLARGLGRKNVFFDVDSIAPGVDFIELLTERVSVCDALVAVIGTDWVSSVDRNNRRRIDNQHDFVRVEIEAALRRGVRVIPVLVDGATMPVPEDLPESLRKLVRLQGVEVSHIRFDTDVRKLTHTLRLWANQLRQQEAAEAERAAREGREKREATEAARAEEARRLAEAEAARLAEEQRRAEQAAEADRAEREERRRRDAAEAAEKVAEARRPGEAEAARQPKDANDGSRLFSGTDATEALSAPRSPPVRAYSPIIAATIVIGIAAALAILVATFDSPAWKFPAPAGDKVAEQAATDKAAADKAAADKAAADKAAADKAAADKAAADRAAADKAAADKAAADKAVADNSAASSTRTQSAETGSESLATLEMKQVCSAALNLSKTEWDPSPVMGQLVANAQRKGLTISACQQLLGLKSSSVGTQSAEIENESLATLEMKQVCSAALNLNKTEWDPSPVMRQFVANAQRNGLTVAKCRLALGL